MLCVFQGKLLVAEATAAAAQRDMDLVNGRKSGLNQQLLCIVTSWHLDNQSASSTPSTTSTEERVRDVSEGGNLALTSDDLEDSSFGLSLTMQLQRVQREAEEIEGLGRVHGRALREVRRQEPAKGAASILQFPWEQ